MPVQRTHIQEGQGDSLFFRLKKESNRVSIFSFIILLYCYLAVRFSLIAPGVYFSIRYKPFSDLILLNATYLWP